MLNVEHLEIHVAHACNLACESCSHYSDQGHKGVVSLEDAERWMAAWSGRIQLGTFSLVGGEPTIHPRLTDFVRLARRHWPDAFLRIVTNGFYLHKHPELPGLLAADPKARLYFSIHHSSPEYLDQVRSNYEMLRRWMRELGVRAFFYHSYKHWRRTYHGTGAAMEPYTDGQPRKSWQHCNAKGCPQLFESKIWKCSPLAYLGMQNTKVGLSDKWKPYLAYQPLVPECTDEEVRAFFAKEEESYCSMCPAEPERLQILIPLKSKPTKERATT
jgi:hypothetical protein